MRLDNGDIIVSQQQYLATLLDNLGLRNFKLTDTLMEVKLQFPASNILDDFG